MQRKILGNTVSNAIMLIPLQAQVEEFSKDAYKCVTYCHHDYEMYNGQPRPINSSTLQESIIPGHKPTEPNGENLLNSIKFPCFGQNCLLTGLQCFQIKLFVKHMSKEFQRSMDFLVLFLSGVHLKGLDRCE